MEIKYIDNFEEWDKLIFESTEGTIFQTSLWFNNSPSIFEVVGLFSDGRLLGGCIFETDENHNGQLKSIAPYLGFTFSNHYKANFSSETQKRYNRELIRDIRIKNKKISFFTSPWFYNLNFIVRNGYDAKLCYTNIIEIQNINEAYNGFSSNLKRNIKAANKIPLKVVRETSISNLLFMIKQSFRRQNEKIWFSMKEVEICMSKLIQNGFASIFTTFHNQRPIASVAIVWDNIQAHYILGGYDHLHSHRAASSIAMWEAIQFANKIGLKYFDLEGSYKANIERFFRQFNTKTIAFYQIIEHQDTVTIY